MKMKDWQRPFWCLHWLSSDGPQAEKLGDPSFPALPAEAGETPDSLDSPGHPVLGQ